MFLNIKEKLRKFIKYNLAVILDSGNFFGISRNLWEKDKSEILESNKYPKLTEMSLPKF